MKRICVFCGSNSGARPEYVQAARGVGHLLATRGIGLVFGGGRVGLMGEVARAAIEKGGEVIGVIPRALMAREVALTDLVDLRVVESMHERKALMADLAEGFISLPGGLGTLEELFEVITWAQLGLHRKPCGLLNVSGYFDQLIGFLDYARDEQFVRPDHRSLLLVDESPEALLRKIEAHRPSPADEAAWARQVSDEKKPPKLKP